MFLCDSQLLLKDCLHDENSLCSLTYLADIFSRLNKLNKSLQGANTTPFFVHDKFRGLVTKIKLTTRELIKNETSTCPLLESFIEENEIQISQDVVSEIHEHCQHLTNEFRSYFTEDLI